MKMKEDFRYFGGLSLLYGLLFAFCLYKNAAGITFPLNGTSLYRQIVLFFVIYCLGKYIRQHLAEQSSNKERKNDYPCGWSRLGKYYSVAIYEYYFFMLAVFGVSGVFGIIIISRLRKIMRTVKERSCFVRENVSNLNIMAVSSMCITVYGKILFR